MIHRLLLNLAWHFVIPAVVTFVMFTSDIRATLTLTQVGLEFSDVTALYIYYTFLGFTLRGFWRFIGSICGDH